MKLKEKDPGMRKFILIKTSIPVLLLLVVSLYEISGQPSQVRISNKDNSWKLEVNDHPFYIKGVVGNEYLSKVKEYGGNSIRIGWHRKELDEAQNLGLNALVNLPANAERYGMDYNDTAAVRKQTEHIISIVTEH